MKYLSQQMAACVAEDAKSSQCMDAVSRRGGMFGKFRYDGVGQLSWVSEGMRRSKGVWKQFLTHVACAVQGSYEPGRQGLHGIMTLNINNVRKDKA
jgi:hypothetical protein